MTADLIVLCAFAFLAGFIDAIAGGGGLIQLPALLIALPATEIPTVLGTHKLASMAGTSVAMGQYARTVEIPWRTMLPAAIAACAASFLGARLVSLLPASLLRPVIFALLVLVALYTFARKDFGALHAPKLSHAAQVWIGAAAGAVLGFYDGFFGPGTGSFLIFLFIAVFGFSFLAASASAKVVNVATNLSAVAYLAATGHVLYHLALPMAACNVAGSVLGSRLAIRKGSAFVRIFFLLVVLVILARLAYDMVQAA